MFCFYMCWCISKCSLSCIFKKSNKKFCLVPWTYLLNCVTLFRGTDFEPETLTKTANDPENTIKMPSYVKFWGTIAQMVTHLMKNSANNFFLNSFFSGGGGRGEKFKFHTKRGFLYSIDNTLKYKIQQRHKENIYINWNDFSINILFLRLFL